MTSELLCQVIAGMPDDFADPDDDHRATRAKMAPLHGHPPAPGTVVCTGTLGGVPVAWVTGPSSDPDRGTVMFVHGGAFVSCDLDEYLFYAGYVAQWTGLPVVAVGYRLAPEHRYPAALDDCLATYRALLTGGHSPQRLLCLGDSCGGGLALSTVLAARGDGLPLPRGMVSLSGWVDLDTSGYGPSPPATRDPFISEGFLRARAGDYLGPDADPRDPGASPARAVLDGLPPVLLQVGATDLCRRDAERLFRRARRAGVDARLDVVSGGIHGIQGLVDLGVPEAVAAWETVRRFVAELLPD
jgi:acetyl esterase/lipase